MQSKISRANPQIWKMAEWLHKNVTWSKYSVVFDWQFPEFKNMMYDKALELLKKINNNEFVGEDNHLD